MIENLATLKENKQNQVRIFGVKGQGDSGTLSPPIVPHAKFK